MKRELPEELSAGRWNARPHASRMMEAWHDLQSHMISVRLARHSIIREMRADEGSVMSEPQCSLCGRSLDTEDNVVGESDYRIELTPEGTEAIEEDLKLFHRECHLTTASIADVRKLRRELGIKQKDLAAEAKIEQGYLSAIERGERDPPAKTANDIIDGLRSLASKRNSNI